MVRFHLHDKDGCNVQQRAFIEAGEVDVELRWVITRAVAKYHPTWYML